MAGIGIRLNRIFSKNTITTHLYGFGYSAVVTIAPMFLVIATIMLMQYLLGFSKVGYASRELYSCTVLYIFIFALLTASPFNAVLSKYMSDVIYNETYEDIMACYNFGLVVNVVFSCLFGIPFCIWEHVVGKVPIYYVFTGYCGYVALVLVFYSMLYLSICKDYKKISLFFLIGMVITVVLSLMFVYLFQVEVTYAMLLAMVIGFWVIACLEYALTKSYFRENSGKYREVFEYFKKYWKLILTNFLYILGLYTHNFVFWGTPMRMEVVNTFVCMTAYDMASFIAMFTNISASVLFITRVEMHFHERYRAYSEAVIGGRRMDIENAKTRMFTQLAEELMNLVRIQFIISVVIFFICITLLPYLGFGGLIMKIYPCLAVGYFILFTMYSAIIFQYYYSDLTGALMTSVSFWVATLFGSIFATHLEPMWYGIGLVIGAMVGWTVAYFRLRYIERELDMHVFCTGSIMERGHGTRPSNLVYSKNGVTTGKKHGKQRT